ncbi:hypothetical protein PPERSA_12321 [Pseudocohnilembus persalinus]|uniref:Uncharacterized protein n=1 Tax=Pseudocohnilembus persalinus TaxID=266149 RepID=A0A0V0R926_PSEPJ|nr:hypothetical protein PPERSA_12321 [Pseudocohnilembus persalinus]|eukprot:KRX10993.1 hypothetical protein PPERSA_12321 [Pseudocohnilembus persalinus]
MKEESREKNQNNYKENMIHKQSQQQNNVLSDMTTQYFNYNQQKQQQLQNNEQQQQIKNLQRSEFNFTLDERERKNQNKVQGKESNLLDMRNNGQFRSLDKINNTIQSNQQVNQNLTQNLNSTYGNQIKSKNQVNTTEIQQSRSVQQGLEQFSTNNNINNISNHTFSNNLENQQNNISNLVSMNNNNINNQSKDKLFDTSKSQFSSGNINLADNTARLSEQNKQIMANFKELFDDKKQDGSILTRNSMPNQNNSKNYQQQNQNQNYHEIQNQNINNDQTFSSQQQQQNQEEIQERDKVFKLIKKQMKINDELENIIKNKDKEVQKLREQKKLIQSQYQDEIIQVQSQLKDYQKKNEILQKEILYLQRDVTKQEENLRVLTQERNKFQELYGQEIQINDEISVALEKMQQQILENQKIQQEQQLQIQQQKEEQQAKQFQQQQKQKNYSQDQFVHIIEELKAILQVNNSGEIVSNIQDLLNQNKTNNKFIRSVSDLTVKCSPQGYFKDQQPNIKQIWKFMKKIVEDYIVMKQKYSSFQQNQNQNLNINNQNFGHEISQNSTNSSHNKFGNSQSSGMKSQISGSNNGESQIIKLVLNYLEIENNKEIIPEIYRIQQQIKQQGQMLEMFKKILNFEGKSDNEIKNQLQDQLKNGELRVNCQNCNQKNKDNNIKNNNNQQQQEQQMVQQNQYISTQQQQSPQFH